jgi:hypothetical protein
VETGCRSAQCPSAVDAGAQLGRGAKTLLQDAGAAQLQPLVGKRVNHAIAQRAARNQQQRRLFALLWICRAASRASSSGEREIADISAAFDFLRLVERQHVERRVALENIFDVLFQQRPDDEGGAILLSLGKQLADRLAGGVVNFQFRRGLAAVATTGCGCAAGAVTGWVTGDAVVCGVVVAAGA